MEDLQGQIPVVLSQAYVDGQWVKYYPQTTAEGVITSAEKSFVSTTQIANWDAAETNANSYTDQTVASEIAKLVNGAPESLDTLKELADALQTIEGSYDGLLAVIGSKAEKSYVDEQLALKADKGELTAITEALAKKADTETVNTALAGKADKAELTTITETLETKADKQETTEIKGQLVTVSMGRDLPVEAQNPGSIFLQIVSPAAPEA